MKYFAKKSIVLNGRLFNTGELVPEKYLTTKQSYDFVTSRGNVSQKFKATEALSSESFKRVHIPEEDLENETLTAEENPPTGEKDTSTSDDEKKIESAKKPKVKKNKGSKKKNFQSGTDALKAALKK